LPIVVITGILQTILGIQIFEQTLWRAVKRMALKVEKDIKISKFLLMLFNGKIRKLIFDIFSNSFDRTIFVRQLGV